MVKQLKHENSDIKTYQKLKIKSIHKIKFIQFILINSVGVSHGTCANLYEIVRIRMNFQTKCEFLRKKNDQNRSFFANFYEFVRKNAKKY